MSGPKTSEYTLTPEQRANLNAQNRCDYSKDILFRQHISPSLFHVKVHFVNDVIVIFVVRYKTKRIFTSLFYDERILIRLKATVIQRTLRAQKRGYLTVFTVVQQSYFIVR